MKRMSMLAAVAGAVLCSTIASAAAPESDLSDFMRIKLKHSQRVVEGLVMGDFDEIVKNSQDMSLLSLAENWQVLQTPQYVEFSRKFRAAADELTAAAKKQNLDQATKAYNQVMLRCVECHKYVRDVRMAQLEANRDVRPALAGKY